MVKYILFIMTTTVFTAVCMVLFFDYETVANRKNYIITDKVKKVTKKIKQINLVENYNKSNNTVDMPDFYGITNDGSLYNISADFAKKNGNFIKLSNVQSILKINKKEQFTLNADNGEIDIESKILHARGGIFFNTTIDSQKCKKIHKKCTSYKNNRTMQYKVYANNIYVNYPAQFINIDGNVKMDAGYIRASSKNIKLDIGQKLATLVGKVHIEIDRTN